MCVCVYLCVEDSKMNDNQKLIFGVSEKNGTNNPFRPIFRPSHFAALRVEEIEDLV